MKTRLFHTIVLCGAALGSAPLGCGSSEKDEEKNDETIESRCKLPDGTCDPEHCTARADGSCVDPCFVHTETCSPDCIQLDGSCGWPPTK
jgi:hypothetical protein